MTKRLQTLVIRALLPAFLLAPCGLTAQNTATCHDLPDLPVKEGLAAPFAGFIEQYLLVGGGCNFPEKPLTEGGKKVYHNTFHMLDMRKPEAGWSIAFRTPHTVAYGATVEVPNGLILLGGMNQDSISRSVLRVSIDSKGICTLSPLPPLPEGIYSGGATLYNNALYIAGGRNESNTNAVYRLDLQHSAAWTRLADYPGAPREQSLLVANEKGIFLIGGFHHDKKKGCTLSTEILKYHPQTNTWTIETELPLDKERHHRCAVGASAISHKEKIIVMGGVDARIFKAAVEGKAGADYLTHPAEWYRFNKDVLCYSTKTGKWKVIPQMANSNRAGAVLLKRNGCLYLVSGELKPGIRTPQIPAFRMHTILSAPVKKTSATAKTNRQ